MNWSGMLPGLLQSNQRAELFAVLVASLRDPRPLDIRSDSEYVCKGFANWESWIVSGWPGEHADLWNQLALEAQSRENAITITWVLGHAKRLDVLRGRTTQEDKQGNDGADALAVSGAASHAVPADIIERATHRKYVAKNVHGMMLDIVRARQKRVPEMMSADRGSDLGSDNESSDSDTELVDSEFMDETPSMMI